MGLNSLSIGSDLCEPADIFNTIRVCSTEYLTLTALVHAFGKTGCQGAAEESVDTIVCQVTGLPDPCRDHELDLLPVEGITAHDHIPAAAIWKKQDQTQRISTVEVPGLVHWKAVKKGTD
jgi:hypothetical protein